MRIRCPPRQCAVTWPTNQRICPITVCLEVQGNIRAVCSEQPCNSFDGLKSSDSLQAQRSQSVASFATQAVKKGDMVRVLLSTRKNSLLALERFGEYCED